MRRGLLPSRLLLVFKFCRRCGRHLPLVLLIALPLSLLLVTIRRLLLIRFGEIPGRIGPMSADLDTYVTLKKKRNPGQVKSLDVFCRPPKHPPFNRSLLGAFSQYLGLAPRVMVVPFLILINEIPLMKPHRVYLNPEGYFEGELNNLVHLQHSKIRIPESEVRKFKEKLPFDIGTKDKTVYLALRDTAYTEKLLGFDGEYAKYRNMDESQIKTIIYTLTNNNFKVIRGGNKANPLTDVRHNDFFDYSNSTIKNDFNDLVLASIADFCIGGDTGLHNLPLLFRKRMFLISTPSFTNKLTSPLIKLVSYCDFIDVKTKKVLNLQQLNERGVFSTTGSTDLFALGVTVQRMDERSISKFILEVLEVESGRWEPSSESLELKSVFLDYLSPHGFKKDSLFNFPNFWAKDSKWLA